jgi:hypothetical protein
MGRYSGGLLSRTAVGSSSTIRETLIHFFGRIIFGICTFFVWLVVGFTTLQGQTTTWQQIKSLSISAPIAAASLDKQGSLLLADTQGNVLKYDTQGRLLQQFRSQRSSAPSHIAAQNTLNLLLFYEDLQYFIITDRFLNPIAQAFLDEGQVRRAAAATLAADGQLWLFDEIDFSLKKYDYRFQEVTLQVALDRLLDPKGYQVHTMQEYQNRLYLQDTEAGLLIFDNLGNYQQTLPQLHNPVAAYADAFRYHTDGIQLFKTPLYQGRPESEALQPTLASDTVKHLLVYGQHAYFITEKHLLIYRKM